MPEVAKQEAVEAPPNVTVADLAHQAALRILQTEEPTPTDKTAATTDAPEDAPTDAPKAVTEEPNKDAPKVDEPAPRRLKVKMREDDGTEREDEVDESEVVKGYIRQEVYKKKTAELARERAGLRDEVKKQVEPTLKEYQDKLGLYEQALWRTIAPEIQNTDWNKLAQENPAEWTQRMQAVNNVQGVLTAIKQEQDKLQGERIKEQREALGNSIKESQNVLRERVPGWNNDLYQKILKAGADHYRFKPEEVNAITDPRAIEALNDARLYRELQQAKPQVSKKVAEVPKVVRPGAVERVDNTREQWNKGMANLKQRGGKDRDAHALAAALLEREGIK